MLRAFGLGGMGRFGDLSFGLWVVGPHDYHLIYQPPGVVAVPLISLLEAC